MKNKIFILILFSLLIFIITPNILAKNIFSGYSEDKVITVYDNKDNYIFSIAMGVSVGDRYISSDNIEYKIEKVEDGTAYAKNLGKISLIDDNKKSTASSVSAVEKRLIAIYHTHNDESYQPGPDSETGRGEIHEIGQRLSSQLKKKGVDVLYSDSIHLPHDGAAYERSRATAVDLARKRPDAIFDIHRDAIPNKDEYLEKVGGKKISQIRLVVGRQNPNRDANDKFARTLKSVSDEIYPGLIRDIFYGGGGYNQEFASRSLLLEFGSHVTGKENAISSTAMFSEVITQLLYGSKSSLSEKSKIDEKRNTFRTFFIFFIIFGLGLFAYLYISEGSMKGVRGRIKNYFKREVIDSGGEEGEK